MSPQPSQQPIPDGNALLTPREVAGLFGVRTTTIARWSREGRLDPIRTPGGHRRFRVTDVRKLIEDFKQAEESAEDPFIAADAVRLYEQGWSIRQVAGRFDYSYGAMRRLLEKRVTLRRQGASYDPASSFTRRGRGGASGSESGMGGRAFP